MRTSRIFWSLLLLFLSLTAAARAQGDRDSLAAATTDPLTVQTAGGNSLAAVEQVWDAANTAYINSDYHRAIDAYRQLILRGYASDKLYYNLANAYFKVGRYGNELRQESGNYGGLFQTIVGIGAFLGRRRYGSWV